MRLRPFALIQPEGVAEAVAELGRAGNARVIAGGTALVPMMRLGMIRPDCVIALDRVKALGGIREQDGALRLGAMVTMADLHRALLVRAGWPLLAEAAGRVATPAIRSSATLGGNLAYAEAASDVAPALLCLEAAVEIAGAQGERTVPIGQFFTSFFETALGPGEIAISISVPPCPPGAVAGYVKFCSRSAEDKPLVGVAALFSLDGPRGRCVDARIALGGVAPTAIRSARAETSLRGETLSDEALRAAAEAAVGDADPLSDLMGTAEYRRAMVRVWVRRLLTTLRDGNSRGSSDHNRAGGSSV